MKTSKIVASLAAAAAVFAAAACGSDTSTANSTTTPMTSTSMAMTSEMTGSSMAPGTDMSSSMSTGSMGTESMGTESMGTESGTESMGTESMTSGDDPASGLVGPGCADYAKANPSGAGSVGGMATAPLAQAASANPLLTTLVAAVSGKLNPKVDLVDTLNGGEFTVFAPVDTAFAKIDSATIDTLKTDSALLTKILTYHVIAGQIAPDKIVGTHKTVEGQDVTVTGSADALKIGDASVICGGVKTKNATVYLVDTVLMPPAK